MWAATEVARTLDVLLDLSLFPCRSRITELGLKEEMADHCQEAGINGPLLAVADLVHCSAYVIVYASPRNAAQHTERMIMGIEQLLVGLKKIGPDDEGVTVAELEVRHLQLDAYTIKIAQSSLQSN